MNKPEKCTKYFDKSIVHAIKYANTPQKEYLQLVLHGFLSGHYQGDVHASNKGDELYRVFMGLNKCKKYYKSELVPSTNKLYRGTSILNAKQIKKIKFRRNNKYYESINKIRYNASGDFQSWTTDIEKAFEFSNFIISAELDYDELLFNENFFKKISIFDEHEVIRLSKKSIWCKLITEASTLPQYNHSYINFEKWKL